jgi:hypothetical protein
MASRLSCRFLLHVPGMLMVFAAATSTATATLAAQSSLRPLAPVAQGASDAAAHKQWMIDASDAQEDFRFAVTDKDQRAATEALARLEGLMARTEDYWTAKKAADGVRLAKDARALAAQAGTAAKSGNMAAATDAFDRMGVTCNTCHELHLEKR